jgi:hypothetical protein
MPRYIVQRTFPEGLHIPIDAAGADACLSVVGQNSEEGVTWVNSFVSEDKAETFCVYDAPSPEAIRRSAARNEVHAGVCAAHRPHERSADLSRAV